MSHFMMHLIHKKSIKKDLYQADFDIQVEGKNKKEDFYQQLVPQAEKFSKDLEEKFLGGEKEDIEEEKEE